MKKTTIFLCLLSFIFFFTGCVTKQKYQELETQYNKCNENLAQTTSEKIDYENMSKEFTQESNN
jgi:PBP1b-binding outer membrane lipoprotein LpoB